MALTTIDPSMIPTDAIDASKIAAGAVGASEIADGAVGNTKLATDAVTQDKVATGVGGEGPTFSAFRNTSTQTVTSGVATKVQLNGEDYDTANAFDSTTNFRFQPTVAGTYLVTGRIAATASSGGTVSSPLIYKNGSFLLNGQPYIPPSGSSSMTTTVTGLVQLNGSTDYVELWANITGAGTITISNGTGVTFLQGTLVRAG
jgi:hypothetical protein